MASGKPKRLEIRLSQELYEDLRIYAQSRDGSLQKVVEGLIFKAVKSFKRRQMKNK